MMMQQESTNKQRYDEQPHFAQAGSHEVVDGEYPFARLYVRLHALLALAMPKEPTKLRDYSRSLAVFYIVLYAYSSVVSFV